MSGTQQPLLVDKNLAYNITEFSKYDDSMTASIIKSLFIYFGYSYQNVGDIFGYKTLDPEDFSKVMKISKANLFRKHPNPQQIQNSKENREILYEREEVNGKFSEYRLWDNYLENALFILSSQPLFESYKGKDDKHDFVTLRNYILVNEISVVTAKANKNRNTKIFYRYKLDEHFENNLRRFFLQTNLSHYIECKRKGLEDFYLLLTNLYHQEKKKGNNKYYLKFERLKLHFSISPNLEPKYQKRKLNQSFKKIEEILAKDIPGLKFDWEAGDGSRFKYSPYFRWDIEKKEEIQKKDNTVLDGVFKNHLKRNLLAIFTSQNEANKNSAKLFYTWLHDKDNKDIHVAAYVSTYSLYNKVRRNQVPGPKVFANTFFSKLYATNSLEEVIVLFKPRELMIVNEVV